ncbi:MAG TPA: tetratricopeptide repeat protein [Cyclobacteriaceae bacterium]|nr:tetratricopeptide repeat protein [Cyclobacteriaceae bacterium]
MKKTCILFLLAILFTPVFAQDAKELNTVGYQLYKEGKYEEAIEYFRKSAEADPQYPFAHYNFACTMAILIGKDFCVYIGEVDNLFDHLYRAVELRPEYREKMQMDPDLKSVSHLCYFRNLTIEPTDNFWIELISGADWVVPAEGQYNKIAGIKFNLDKSLNFWYLDLSSDPVQRMEITGTYEDNSQGRYTITLESGYNGETVFQGGFSEDLSIYFSGINFRFIDYDATHCGM